MHTILFPVAGAKWDRRNSTLSDHFRSNDVDEVPLVRHCIIRSIIISTSDVNFISITNRTANIVPRSFVHTQNFHGPAYVPVTLDISHSANRRQPATAPEMCRLSSTVKYPFVLNTLLSCNSHCDTRNPLTHSIHNSQPAMNENHCHLHRAHTAPH